MKTRQQQTVCEWMGVSPIQPDSDSIIGIAIESLTDGVINGLRHPEENGSNGWYIWCGEYSEDEKFFSPVCIEHLENYLDITILDYLSLPPGYRFLIDNNNHEDVWFDENLLDI